MIKNNLWLTCVIALFLLLYGFSLLAQHRPNISAPGQAPQAAKASFPKADLEATYSYKVISAEMGTYGYEIQQNGRPMIKQLTVPGMAGKKGFTTKSDAEKVAGLIISKLSKGEMPPSVTPEEIQNLKLKK